MPRPTTAARRYAEAAFDIAVRDGAVEPWIEHLERAAALVSREEVANILGNPAVPFERRREGLERALGPGLPRPVLNLLLLLLRRRRIELLPRLAAEFRRLVNRRAGIVEATATSASTLRPDEVEALRERLERITGGRVDLRLEVDPGLLGGVVVRVGDRLIDGSVRGRLERLRSQLAAGAI
jgi:F-type H+-transporting ATPase subunit delta